MTQTTATASTIRHISLNVLDLPFAVMGIVNVTPDSFFDGGRYATVDSAVRHGCALVNEGAVILDVGGESTRPGAAEVSVEEECRRVVPVVKELVRETGAVISVDTRKADVAARAIDAGASWINDVSAGRFDPRMAQVAAAVGCPVVLMHSRKTPGDMQVDPAYDNAPIDVARELNQSVALFRSAGVELQNIILDPGIGFAKRLEDNIMLIRNLEVLSALGFPILIGISRKSFIGKLTGKESEARLAGSLAGIGVSYRNGARIFRVHDVAETVDYLKVHCALTVDR